MEQKIKSLLESPVLEDIVIGLKILIKQTKVRKHKDLKDLLKGIKFNITEDADLYVSRFNIFLCNSNYGDIVFIYSCRAPAIDKPDRVIRL